MKVAVIGLGYWGPNLVRNFLTAKGVSSVVGCDQDASRREGIEKKFPTVTTYADVGAVLADDSIAAVVIATPASTHADLAKRAMAAGKHVLVEKPMATTSEDARAMIALAREKERVLMVDHTFLFTGAVRKLKNLQTSGEIGDILYFDSVRVNLGLFQHDTNVIWDLAPHDFSIMDHLLDKEPVSVIATGAKHYYDKENLAYVAVQFADQTMAHFHVNWLSPVKVRKILIGGTAKMVVFDDMEPSEKIKVYDRGVEIKDREEVYRTLVQYRTGDMFAPHLEQTEALALVAAEFVDCIHAGRQPLSDGQSGLNVVRLLEAADHSLRAGGSPVKLA